MRLIDADAFIERIKKDPLFPLVERYGLTGVIETQPTVDPVTRCKDCKHRDVDGFCKGRGWPIQLVPDDGFCDKGKRSEDG